MKVVCVCVGVYVIINCCAIFMGEDALSAYLLYRDQAAHDN